MAASTMLIHVTNCVCSGTRFQLCDTGIKCPSCDLEQSLISTYLMFFSALCVYQAKMAQWPKHDSIQDVSFILLLSLLCIVFWYLCVSFSGYFMDWVALGWSMETLCCSQIGVC